jgi:outer membrane protein assembly factor BamB
MFCKRLNAKCQIMKKTQSENQFFSLPLCIFAVSIFLVQSGLAVGSPSWPQWHGPNRNAKSTETALLKSWPPDGPPLLWSLDGLGEGFSTVSLANGLIYTTGKVQDDLILFAIDLNGKLKWHKSCGPAFSGPHPGARSTPTIDGDYIYVITGRARVVCMKAKTGDPIWAVDAAKKFNAELSRWGIAESPLIFDNKIICTPGGPDAIVAALDKMTGRTLWTSKGLNEKHAYCSPQLIQKGSRKLIVTITDKNTLCIDADNGTVLWRRPIGLYKGKPRDINPNTPLHHDGCIYVTTGHIGGVKLKLSHDASVVSVLWEDLNLDCYHGGVVLIDNYLYGSTYDGSWACVNWNTGVLQYKHKWHGKGSIFYADDMLYCYEEKKGTLALVNATPNSFDIVSSFQITQGSAEHWAHPVICDGRLYLRHGNTLLAYNIKATR